MKLAAITRFQAGRLRELLDLTGWTQKELAERARIPASRIGLIMNLRVRMNARDIKCLNRAFDKAGIAADLTDEWPEGWKGLPADKRKITEIRDVPTEQLIDHRELKQIAAPETSDREKLAARLDELTQHLDPDELELLWLRDGEGWTFVQIGKHFGRGSQAIHAAYLHVLRKIRNAMTIDGGLKKNTIARSRIERSPAHFKYMRYPDEEPLPKEVEKLMVDHEWIRTPQQLYCRKCNKIIRYGDRYFVPVMRLMIQAGREGDPRYEFYAKDPNYAAPEPTHLPPNIVHTAEERAEIEKLIEFTLAQGRDFQIPKPKGEIDAQEED